MVTNLQNLETQPSPATVPDGTTPQPQPTPQPVEGEIVVTPANYRSLLKNIGKVNFGGSTSQYVQVTGEEVRLELPTNYENVEISARVKVVHAGANQDYLVQQYGRGGHHGDVVTVPMPGNTGHCMGCAYKGRFLNTATTFNKEVNHPAYCGNRKDPAAASHAPLIGRWAELKTTIQNFPAGNDVKLENFVDGKLCSTYTDRGDWSNNTNDYLPNCPARERGNTGNRKRNERLNLPGVLVAWRSDAGTIWQFEWLKVKKLP